MFNTILLEHYREQDAKILSNRIDGLSKINIFIGPNNAGKSRLIRTLFSNDEVEWINDSDEISSIDLLLSKIKSETFELENKIVGFKIPENIVIPDRIKHTIFKQNIDNQALNAFQQHHFVNSANFPHITGHYKEIVDNAIDERKTKYQPLMTSNLERFRTTKFLRIYIPILRGLRKLTGQDLYLDLTKKQYLFDDNALIFTGQQLYEEFTSLLLGSRQQRIFAQQFESFISKYFFDGKRLTIIPSQSSKTITLSINGEDDIEIHNLGDAFQSIIICLYPLFLHKDNNLLVFIEEPEIHLHPGWQRKLLEAWNDPMLNHCQFFITTHSNHFLELDFEKNLSSVYNVSKKTDITDVQLVDHPNFNILENIGVKDGSLFRTNCTIWVEGPSDKIVINKIIELYNNQNGTKFKQDIHYSFVEYSGSNLTHWDFSNEGLEGPEKNVVTRLCSTAFVVADSDSAELLGKEGKKQRQRRLKQVLDDRIYITTGYELECLLPVEIVGKVVREWFPSLGISESPINIDEPFTTILSNLVLKESERTKVVSRYIKNKVGFASLAVNHMNSVESLSKNLKMLGEKLHSFIKERNS